jgi:hypothetical protein
VLRLSCGAGLVLCLLALGGLVSGSSEVDAKFCPASVAPRGLEGTLANDALEALPDAVELENTPSLEQKCRGGGATGLE